MNQGVEMGLGPLLSLGTLAKILLPVARNLSYAGLNSKGRDVHQETK